MKTSLYKFLAIFLMTVFFIFMSYLVAKTAIEVINVQYTMNAIANLNIVGNALMKYKRENGAYPEASNMNELLTVLDIKDAAFKKSNPSLTQIQYKPELNALEPYLCIWESNEKWGLFRFLRSEYSRHELLLMWEDGNICCTHVQLDKMLKTQHEWKIKQHYKDRAD